MDQSGFREDAFPAKLSQATGAVNGVSTEVSRTDFSDKVLLTISQEGRLAQWVRLDPSLSNHHKRKYSPIYLRQVQVPLTAPSPATIDTVLPGSSSGSLPATHLTATTLLGGGNEARENIGRLYAAQIASLLNARDPEDRRILLVGLGLGSVDGGREAFFDVLELVQKVL
jgi:proteasome assembly chaperone 3